jgi:hypothetical protein
MRLTKLICTKLTCLPSRKISDFVPDHARDKEPDYAGIPHKTSQKHSCKLQISYLAENLRYIFTFTHVQSAGAPGNREARRLWE